METLARYRKDNCMEVLARYRDDDFPSMYHAIAMKRKGGLVCSCNQTSVNPCKYLQLYVQTLKGSAAPNKESLMSLLEEKEVTNENAVDRVKSQLQKIDHLTQVEAHSVIDKLPPITDGTLKDMLTMLHRELHCLASAIEAGNARAQESYVSTKEHLTGENDMAVKKATRKSKSTRDTKPAKRVDKTSTRRTKKETSKVSPKKTKKELPMVQLTEVQIKRIYVRAQRLAKYVNPHFWECGKSKCVTCPYDARLKDNQKHRRNCDLLYKAAYNAHKERIDKKRAKEKK